MCTDPGREKVVAPIVRFKNVNVLAQSSAVLVSLDEIQSFFTRHVYIFIKKKKLIPFLSLSSLIYRHTYHHAIKNVFQ